MENQNKINTTSDFYAVSDLKLQSFLRSMHPDSFFGVNKNSNKVVFLFKKSKEIVDMAEGYLRGDKFTMSPLAMAHYLDEGKALIFNDYKI
ncbi:hypothetical protein A2619_03995 [candidate division WWE3 bacterium RIFOXYD1_FULL_39_9]|uniref:DUF5659 domain-containing protein n=1 Tax=candidate division WWE3 bacterium RIFOXYD1_FULL_39_9 TaxID=1802649 RepID=A0A1F4X9C4_UNCKA|nr:MAG: hypothetical protein A2619_03995 [candidate division WWE3 bacterium RIFOXYD1_FULL_39_9]